MVGAVIRFTIALPDPYSSHLIVQTYLFLPFSSNPKRNIVKLLLSNIRFVVLKQHQLQTLVFVYFLIVDTQRNCNNSGSPLRKPYMLPLRRDSTKCNCVPPFRLWSLCFFRAASQDSYWWHFGLPAPTCNRPLHTETPWGFSTCPAVLPMASWLRVVASWW